MDEINLRNGLGVWKESCVVDQRLLFLSSRQKEEMSLTDLCHEYGISGPTEYK